MICSWGRFLALSHLPNLNRPSTPPHTVSSSVSHQQTLNLLPARPTFLRRSYALTISMATTPSPNLRKHSRKHSRALRTHCETFTLERERVRQDLNSRLLLASF